MIINLLNKKIMLNNILKYGLYLSLFTPLLVWNKLFFPYVATKAFVFYFLIEVLLVIFLFSLYKSPKRFVIKKDWILYSLLIFTGISILAGIFGVDFYISFWSMFERMDGIFNFIHFIAFFILLRAIFNNETQWIKFLRIAIFASFTVTSYGIYQHLFVLGAEERIYSTIGNPIYLASYLIPHIFLGFYLLYFYLKNNFVSWTVYEIKKYFYSFWLWFYVVITGLNIWALFLTQTRGAILGFLAGLIISGILLIIFSQNKKKLIFLFILPILIITFYVIGLLWNSVPIERFKTSFINPDQTRILQWQTAYKSFLERPILGFGSGNYLIAQNKSYNPEILRFTGAKYDRAHNKILEIAVDSGIAGLISYLFIFGITITLLFKRKKDEPFLLSILIGLFVAFFVQNIFIFDTHGSYLSLIISLAFISFLLNEKNSLTAKKMPSSILFVVLIVILFSFWYGILEPYKTSRALSYANSLEYEGKTGKELALYKYIESLQYSGAGQYNAIIHSARFINNNFPNQESINLIINSLEEYKKRVPENTLIKGFLANFYIYNGSIDKKYFDLAENNIKSVIEISPNRPEFYDGLGVVLYEKGNYKESRDAYNKYYELHPMPDKADYNFKIALTYYKQGNKVKAIEYAKKVLEINSSHSQARELLKILK